MARCVEKSRTPLRRVLLVACVLLVSALAVIVGANAATVLITRGNVHTVSQLDAELHNDPADAVVVLGASVYPDGRPSDILADRIEVAVDLYKAGAVRAIICSGDNQSSHYNESDAMKAYCVKLGVPSEDVYVDHGGVTTYDSMYRARYVFGAERIVVATQGYHLYRAMFIADCLGMQTWGVACDKGTYDNQIAYSLREVMARTKDFFAAMLALPVDTAGKTVLLEASGDET